jgi:hypothetical protein
MSDRRGPAYTVLTEAGLTSVHSVSKAVAAVARWASHGRWRAATPQGGGPVPLLLQPQPQSVGLAQR